MAKIAAFRGIHYNESVTGDLGNVVSPPYDIISPEDRVHYHQLHPNNFVRLILGEEFESDDDTKNRFTRAKGYLDDWIAQGVMTQDKQPAIYVYQQRFERDGEPKTIRGLTCAVLLHDYAEKVILPHENTLAKPKSQLIHLIRNTRSNLDSVYGLYADPDGVLDRVMDRVMETAPAADTHDKDGVRHRMWMVTDRTEIGIVKTFLEAKPIAIADGHHRYETALAYRNEVRENHGYTQGDQRELPSDYALMTIVNVHQEDMTIFPTHRVVAGLAGEALEGFEARLTERFDVAESTKENLLADMAGLGAIGLYFGGRAVTLTPKPGASDLIDGSEASRSLELNVLHKLILEPILEIDDQKLRDQTHIIYTRDPEEAIALVDSGERQAAFLLNHIAVKSVLDIASAGEKMPQKATYFYPKLLSGLVLRKMD